MSSDSNPHSASSNFLSQPSIPHLAELLNILPSPLTIALVRLSRPIACIRRIAEITSWQSSWEESWLLLATWWACCLLADISIRYTLPLVVLLLFIRDNWKKRPPSSLSPVTETTLHKTISDLEKISALVPVPCSLPTTAISIPLRVSATLYIPYLLLFYLVRLRVLVALAGTIILTWRAPWAHTIRHALWRSAWIRWLTYKIWSLLSGEPLQKPILHKIDQHVTESVVQPNAKSPIHDNSTSLRFEFTIYENQRWWMGLDWTAALLPQERPAWSSASEQPVAPPSVFTLPASATVYSKSGSGRMKRVATWKWEEDEWRLLVKKEGSGASRIERPLPSPKEELPAGAKLLKAAGMMKDHASTSEHRDEHPVLEEEEEVSTDNDGWVYSDNKWESRSGKRGMGKYTRYRRWTRIAVLTETVELVGPGDIGVHREEQPVSVLMGPPAPEVTPVTVTRNREASIDSESERQGIRQRLKAAITTL